MNRSGAWPSGGTGPSAHGAPGLCPPWPGFGGRNQIRRHRGFREAGRPPLPSVPGGEHPSTGGGGGTRPSLSACIRDQGGEDLCHFAPGLPGCVPGTPSPGGSPPLSGGGKAPCGLPPRLCIPRHRGDQPAGRQQGPLRDASLWAPGWAYVPSASWRRAAGSAPARPSPALQPALRAR